MTAAPVNLLLIGAGRMGLTHLRALRDSQAVRIAAVVDPSARARERAGDVHGYADVESALEREPVDGVLIAAPSTLHRELVSDCAALGLPILCEKPCGVSAADIDAAADAARAHGVALQVGYWRRFVPALRELREQLQSGRFGELLFISCWQWDAEPPDQSFRASSGGIVVDMAVHELDLMRWLTGEELEGGTLAAARGRDPDDPDAAAALLRLSGGGVALISLGRHFPHGDCVWVELMGTRDQTRVDVLWGEAGDRVFLDALRAQAEDFGRTIRGGAGAGIGASAADARRTLELAAQLARS
jgi:myo-inositol 2-dehydrogenase/D-chiro-inositol 1-dehydrogenase